MKIKIIIISVISIYSALAKVSISPEMNACRQIELMIGIEFLAEGKEIPATWDEIPTIQRMRSDIQGEYVDASSLNLLRNLNSFAIVPNAPEIAVEPGISVNLSEKRLFSISRKPSFKDTNGRQAERGRYAVLLSSGGTTVDLSWIPEDEVSIILSQIRGFDPSDQPLPFPEIDKISKLSKERKEKSLHVIREHHREKATRGDKEQPLRSRSDQEGSDLRWVWVASGLLILALAALCGNVVLRRKNQ